LTPPWSLFSIWRLLTELAAVLTRASERGFVALNPETGTTTQDETVIDSEVFNLNY
jgi:hypothetical protein